MGVGDGPLTDDEAIVLMQREPSIIRRPIFEIDGEIVVGFDQPALAKRLG